MTSIRQTVLELEIHNKKAIESFKQIDDKLNAIIDRNKKLEKSTNKVWSVMKAGIAYVGLRNVVQQMADFEEASVGAKFAINGLSANQLPQFNNEIIEMSKRVPYSATQLMKMAVELGKSGVEYKDLNEMMNTTIDSAKNWDMSVEETGNVLGIFKNILKLSNKELRDHAAMISGLADQSVTTESAIIDVEKRIAGTGAAAGLSANQIAGLSATMLSLGVAPERAAMALDNLIGVARKSRKPGEQIYDTITRIFGELDKIKNDKDLLNATEKLFGKSMEGANIDKLRQYLKAVKEGKAGLVDLMKYAMYNQEDANKIFDQLTIEKLKTANAQFQIMKNNLVALALKLSTVVLPIVNKLLEWIVAITDAPAWMKWSTAAVASFAIIFASMLKLINLMKDLVKWTTIQAAIQAVAVAFTNPAQFVAAGVAALAAVGIGGYAIYKYMNHDNYTSSGLPTKEGNQPTTNPNIPLNQTTQNLNNSNSTNQVNMNVTQNINGTGNPTAVANQSARGINDLTLASLQI